MDILALYNQYNNFGRHLNMTYEVIEAGKIKYQLPISSDLLATPAAAHGGAIAGFMDAVVGVAALSDVVDEGKVVSTIEFKINFTKAALMGDMLTGKGEVLTKGKRTLVVKGEIFNQKEELIATALATLNAYPIEKSAMLK